ncbi:hypothetical protein CH302_27665 [Rhodococcus sp. 15-2388-1-1a]|nr:hypothetical protein CH302_27665 [Rhodococcus sp. 15-2388-1-1a]
MFRKKFRFAPRWEFTAIRCSGVRDAWVHIGLQRFPDHDYWIFDFSIWPLFLIVVDRNPPT